jgi:hypothetical protein
MVQLGTPPMVWGLVHFKFEIDISRVFALHAQAWRPAWIAVPLASWHGPALFKFARSGAIL